MHQAARRRFPWAAVALATAGGALLVVGSFQSWSEISGGGTTAALYGIPDRSLAWATLGAGIAVLVLTIVVALTRGAARRVGGLLLALVALAGLGVGVYEAITSRNDVIDDFARQLAGDYGGTTRGMRELLDQAVGTGQLTISVGMGVYLVIAGGGLAVAGGLLALRRGPEALSEPTVVPGMTGVLRESDAFPESDALPVSGAVSDPSVAAPVSEVPPPPAELVPSPPMTEAVAAPVPPAEPPPSAWPTEPDVIEAPPAPEPTFEDPSASAPSDPSSTA